MRRKAFFFLSSLLLLALTGGYVAPDLSVWASPVSQLSSAMTAPASSSRSISMPMRAMEQPQTPLPNSVQVRVSGPIRTVPQQLTGEWVVGNVTVFVDADTHILPRDYVPQVGDWADVWATARTDTSLLAIHIKVINKDETDFYCVEFKGLIEGIAEDYLVISGVTVHVDDHTQVRGAPPALGFIAQVCGFSQMDGSVAAILVQIVNPLKVYIEFEGIIQDFPPVPPYHGVWRAGRLTVIADGQTEISGLAPRIGLNVEISGVLKSDECIRATEIRVIDPGRVPIEGLVRSIGDTEWVIGDTVVQVDENTFIDESKASAAVGAWAEASVRVTEGGDLLAIRIRLKRPH